MHEAYVSTFNEVLVSRFWLESKYARVLQRVGDS